MSNKNLREVARIDYKLLSATGEKVIIEQPHVEDTNPVDEDMASAKISGDFFSICLLYHGNH